MAQKRFLRAECDAAPVRAEGLWPLRCGGNLCNIMKTNYTKPTTAVFPVTGENHLLAASADGVNATISGYEAAESNGSDGFTQDD
ncbi:MAG: hypothetical protein IJ243_04295 [Prevotella sp.]|nr:hypothetical protein [Prevotella sp.]